MTDSLDCGSWRFAEYDDSDGGWIWNHRNGARLVVTSYQGYFLALIDGDDEIEIELRGCRGIDDVLDEMRDGAIKRAERLANGK